MAFYQTGVHCFFAGGTRASVQPDRFASVPLQAVHEIETDAQPHQRDRAFLRGVLGLDKALFQDGGAMSLLRAKLAVVPSIRGQIQTLEGVTIGVTQQVAQKFVSVSNC